MPSHVKTYDGSEDPEDHLKLFQAATKTERWAMPTWCHVFNSTLTENARVWFDKLPRESIDSYEDLRTTFMENYLQQTKHIKDPVEIHHIKQRDGESTEDFMERYKAEILDVEGAPECMKISGFMHGITHPELIKRLYEKMPRSLDEMYRVTTSFLQWEVAAFSHSRKKHPRCGNSQKEETSQTLKRVSKISKDRIGSQIAEKTDRRDDQVRQIVSIHQRIKAERQAKGTKAGITPKRSPSHLMIQPWERVAKQRVTQSFSPETTISFPSLGEEDGTEGPMIIEAEIGGHFVTISTQWNNRHNGHKKDPCRTIHDTRNVLEEKIKVVIHPEYPEQTIAIGSTLTEKGRKELCALLKQNLDIFAWKPADMTGVPRHMAEHRLNVQEGCRAVRQKKKGQAPERNKAIQEEVEKLVDARIMKEFHYHTLYQPGHVKTRWELANVYGFQRSKQSMSTGRLSLAGDRLESRVSLRIPF
ncbi:reverse transcriptase domain-containing protein [Tanacetum coccineum]|uniref:Reverse transcriptase domain-containing protein n=1 Tax=Tanacetum coccineum TaxID=301880 RepID=A0ABQ4YI50_9ASTR